MLIGIADKMKEQLGLKATGTDDIAIQDPTLTGEEGFKCALKHPLRAKSALPPENASCKSPCLVKQGSMGAPPQTEGNVGTSVELETSSNKEPVNTPSPNRINEVEASTTRTVPPIAEMRASNPLDPVAQGPE